MKLFWDKAESEPSASSIPEHKYMVIMMMLLLVTMDNDDDDDDDGDDDDDDDVDDDDDDDGDDLCEGGALSLPPDRPAESG